MCRFNIGWLVDGGVVRPGEGSMMFGNGGLVSVGKKAPGSSARNYNQLETLGSSEISSVPEGADWEIIVVIILVGVEDLGVKLHDCELRIWCC